MKCNVQSSTVVVSMAMASAVKANVEARRKAITELLELMN